jgi:hypothetical protein
VVGGAHGKVVVIDLHTLQAQLSNLTLEGLGGSLNSPNYQKLLTFFFNLT